MIAPDNRITSLSIDNLPVYLVGEVLELLREHFSVEINLAVDFERRREEIVRQSELLGRDG